jgi:hypothetical protein
LSATVGKNVYTWYNTSSFLAWSLACMSCHLSSAALLGNRRVFRPLERLDSIDADSKSPVKLCFVARWCAHRQTNQLPGVESFKGTKNGADFKGVYLQLASFPAGLVPVHSSRRPGNKPTMI